MQVIKRYLFPVTEKPGIPLRWLGGLFICWLNRYVIRPAVSTAETIRDLSKNAGSQVPWGEHPQWQVYLSLNPFPVTLL